MGIVLTRYFIDAFVNEIYQGNPACVMPLSEWLPDDLLLSIAKKNGVAETAYFIDHGKYVHLRWFTPDIEMDLCGHATLATAYVLANHLGHKKNEISFSTQSGILQSIQNGNSFTLRFPSRNPISATLPDEIKLSLSIQPIDVLKARDYVLIYSCEKDVRNIVIDRAVFDLINLDPGGVVVTSKGEDVDFVSRFFTPQASILEDPVTGSAHCSLIPYWSTVLKKSKMIAHQLSDRGGEIFCELKENQVLLSGKARTALIDSVSILYLPVL